MVKTYLFQINAVLELFIHQQILIKDGFHKIMKQLKH